MNPSDEQIKQLQKFKAWLSSQGYKGTAYQAAWKRGTELILHPEIKAREQANANKLLGEGSSDWSKMTGLEKAKSLEHSGISLLGGLIDAEMPKSKSELAGDVAQVGTLAIPGGEEAGLGMKALGLLGRVGIPPAVAGTTAALTGEDPTAATMQTGIQSAFGEVAGAAVNALGRKSARAIQRGSVKTIGDIIRYFLPDFKGNPLKENADIYDAFSSTNARNAVNSIGNLLKRVEGHISTTAPFDTQVLNNPFLSDALTAAGLSPNPSDNYTFAETVKAIKSLNDKAWTFDGDPTKRAEGKTLRKLTHDAREELQQEMDGIVPGIGTKYINLRNEEASALTFRRVFQDKAVDLASGTMNIPEVQSLLLNGGDLGYADELVRSAGPQAVNAAQEKLLRGARPGSAMDSPQKGLLSSLRVYMHSPTRPPGIGFHPRTVGELGSRYAGNVRRFPKIPSLKPGFGILSGPAARAISDLGSPDGLAVPEEPEPKLLSSPEE